MASIGQPRPWHRRPTDLRIPPQSDIHRSRAFALAAGVVRPLDAELHRQAGRRIAIADLEIPAGEVEVITVLSLDEAEPPLLIEHFDGTGPFWQSLQNGLTPDDLAFPVQRPHWRRTLWY